jgi:hypothetical protein
MKKIVLTVVAMMTLTFGYAENGSNGTESNRVENRTERYDMNFDMRRLAVKLDLNSNQMEAVEAIHDCFYNDMQEAATARGFERRHLVHQAVRKDAHQMHRVLNDKQFNTYMMLLMTTLHNRGL